ncbi:MAG: type II toxin-antitoxin system RelE/ParE family toxin [Chloroflexi bacterium]|nr:type II toxin-antitoxin system RelE/ParE family toxin [Chloroflexota bacterium]
MDVVFHPEALEALARLPTLEQTALSHAVEKLEALGIHLPFPHASHVRGSNSIWELRPRAGRSRWRAFYRRIGDVFVIAAVGPESQVDPAAFAQSVASAERRLDEITP